MSKPINHPSPSQSTAHLLPWTGLAEIDPNGSYVILRRFTGKIPTPDFATSDWLQANQASLRKGLVIDVETTGLDRKTDTVIELGMRPFSFIAKTGEVVSLGEQFTALQDPGRPLDPEISALTGITDADLAGKSIAWDQADALIAQADVVIAHNAGFDRPFIDRQSPASRSKLWACSYRQIDWSEKNLPSSKLEILCHYHGFFTAAHRAQNDVDALLLLLSLTDRTCNQPYLKELISRADQPYVRVIAAGSPFETKDLLKGRGYRWDGAARVWQKDVISSELKLEVEWLEASIYRGTFRGTTLEIPVLNNFKA